MNRIGKYSRLIVAALILGLGSMAGGAFVGASMIHAGAAPAAVSPVREAATMPTTFAPVVKAVLPAVVNISSTKIVKASELGEDNPFGRMFPGFGSQMPDRPQRQEGEGSGVIVSSDGYIVTNNHVISDEGGNAATEITVTLHNSTKPYKARVIGKDPNYDLAVLKIDGTGLPFMLYGNSDDVQLGQWVLAVGYQIGRASCRERV